MAAYTLEIRKGPKVEREGHEALDGLVDSMRAHVQRVRAEGPLPEVKMLRTFEPEARVAARLEVSAGKRFRKRAAGVDVMGDGSLVAFSGGALKRPLDVADEGDPFPEIAALLAG